MPKDNQPNNEETATLKASMPKSSVQYAGHARAASEAVPVVVELHLFSNATVTPIRHLPKIPARQQGPSASSVIFIVDTFAAKLALSLAASG